jgi:hypothetical protein
MMHLVGMNTLLILLSLGPENHHPRGQDITLQQTVRDVVVFFIVTVYRDRVLKHAIVGEDN